MFFYDKIVISTETNKPEISNTKFSDIEGIDDVRQELEFLVQYLKV